MADRFPYIIITLITSVFGISHLMFGTMHRWVRCAIFLVILLSLLLYIVNSINKERIVFVRSHLVFIWLIVFGAMLLQVMPLPQGWLLFLAPKSREILHSLGETQSIISFNAFFTEEVMVRFFCYVVLFFLIIHNARSKKLLTILASTILFVAALQVMYGLANREQMLWIVKDRPRLSGTFTNRNHFACLLAMASMIGCGLFLALKPRHWHETTKAHKLFVGIVGGGILLTLTGTLLSLSKGAQASLGISFLLFAAIFVLHKRPKIWVIFTILAIMILTIFVNIEGTKRWEQDQLDYSLEYRLQLYKASLPMIADYPLTGVGLGNFQYIYRQYQPPSKFLFSYLHNDWLQIISEFGIVPSLLLFYIFIYFFISTAYKLWRRKDSFYKWLGWGALCAVLVMMLHSLVDFNFLRTLSNSITTFGCAAIASVCANNRKWKEQQLPSHIIVIPILLLTLFIGWNLILWLRADVHYTLYENWKNEALGSVPQQVTDKQEAMKYLKTALQLNPREPEYYYQKAIQILNNMREDLIKEAQAIVEKSNPTLKEDDSQLFYRELTKQLRFLEITRFPSINMQIELAYLENQKALRLLPISPKYQSLNLLIQTSKIYIFFLRNKQAPQKYIERFTDSLKKVAYIAPKRPKSLFYIGKALSIYSIVFPEEKPKYTTQIINNFRKALFSELSYAEEIYSLVIQVFQDQKYLLQVTPDFYLHYDQLYNFCWREQYFDLCAQILHKMPQLPQAPLEWKRTKIKIDNLEMIRRHASIAEINHDWQQRQQLLDNYRKELKNYIEELIKEAKDFINKGRYYQAYQKYEEITTYDYSNVKALLELCELSLLPELRSSITYVPARHYLERIVQFNKHLSQDHYRKFLLLLQEIGIDDNKSLFLKATAHILAGEQEQGKEMLIQLTKDKTFFTKWRQAHLLWHFLHQLAKTPQEKDTALQKLYEIVPSFQVKKQVANPVMFSQKLLLQGYDMQNDEIKFTWQFQYHIKGYVAVEFLDKDLNFIERYIPKFMKNKRRYPLDFVRFGEVLTTKFSPQKHCKYMKIYCVDNKKRLKTDIGNYSFFTTIK